MRNKSLKKIFYFFDKLEDAVRGWFSHYPIPYALVGGVGVVIFWRGVWHSYDYLMWRFFTLTSEGSTVDLGGLPWWDGPASLLIGSCLLLVTGVFVSSFIGNEVIITGLKGEKKTAEKTEEEVKTEAAAISGVRREMEALRKEVEKLRLGSSLKPKTAKVVRRKA